MKLLATKNCPITKQEMTSRPLKKAKYACQVKGGGEHGLRVSARQLQGNVSAADNSSDDSGDAIMKNIESPIDHSEQYLPSSSIGNFTPAMSTNNSAGIDIAQIASTSSVVHNFNDETVENARANLPGERNDCDCNANKNITPKQVNLALCRWQSKQLAQGIIDNAINKVLGDLGIPSNHNEVINPAFGEPISWGSYLNAQNIENEGVVEAIRQQGLQHKRFVEQPSGSQQPDSTKNNIPRESTEEILRSGFNGPSASSFSQNVLCPTTDLLVGVPSASLKNSFGDKSDPSLLLSVKNPILQHPHLFVDEDTMMKPEDLLSTAVSYAISEKGLGVLNVNE